MVLSTVLWASPSEPDTTASARETPGRTLEVSSTPFTEPIDAGSEFVGLVRAAQLASVAAQARLAAPEPPEPPVVPQSVPEPPVTTSTAPTPPPPTTTTPPPPPPAPSGACGGYVPTIERYWPADQVSKVCSVIACETGGTFSPTIENPRSTASGLLQFLDGTWRQARVYVAGAEAYARASHAPAEIQIAVGAAWWSRTSWAQWECA